MDALSKSSSSSKSGGDGGYKSSYTANPGWDEEKIKAFQEAHGLTVDGVWGPQTANAYDNDPDWVYDGGTPTTGFTGSTYKEAAAYLKSNGKSSSGLMTSSEWVRHKNKNNSAGGEHEASSYQEYLAAFIYDLMN